MKHVLVLMIFALSAPAFAVEAAQPLFIKSKTSGFVPAHLTNSSVCKVYSNKVVIEKSAAYLTSVRSFDVEIDGDVMKQIEAAEKGTITKGPAPTDGPITSYVAVLPLANAKPKYVVLKEEGSKRTSNDAVEAISLVNFIDQLCQ